MTELIGVNPSKAMLNGVIFSIKPHFMELIISRDKVYEFRNFCPKAFNSYFWVYETKPNKMLKYVIKVSSPTLFPKKIAGSSYGVDRFNNGTMNSKYAFKIEELYILNNPLSLISLQHRFNFTAPQAFTYLFKNIELQNFLQENASLLRLF